jgi:hypothetical protein
VRYWAFTSVEYVVAADRGVTLALRSWVSCGVNLEHGTYCMYLERKTVLNSIHIRSAIDTGLFAIATMFMFLKIALASNDEIKEDSHSIGNGTTTSRNG